MLSVILATIIVVLQITSCTIAIYGAISKEGNPYFILTEVGIDFAVIALMFVQLIINPQYLSVLNICIWGVVLIFDFIKARNCKWGDGGDNYAI